MKKFIKKLKNIIYLLAWKILVWASEKSEDQVKCKIYEEEKKYREIHHIEGQDAQPIQMPVEDYNKYTEIVKMIQKYVVPIQNAWNKAGKNPRYHILQKTRLKKEWKTLYVAIVNLINKI